MLHPETLKILILWGVFPIRLNATNISFLNYTNILKALKLGCYERESVQTPPGNAACFTCRRSDSHMCGEFSHFPDVEKVTRLTAYVSPRSFRLLGHLNLAVELLDKLSLPS